MNAATTGRRSKRSAGVAGLLLAVWFGLGIQPCALASGDDHDCPHCPPSAEAAGSHAHHARTGDDSHAGHDTHAGHGGLAENPCGAMQADCCDPGTANIDSRIFDFKFTGDNAPALVAAPQFRNLVPVYSPEHDRVADPPQYAVVSPALHKLHCVYLD